MRTHYVPSGSRDSDLSLAFFQEFASSSRVENGRDGCIEPSSTAIQCLGGSKKDHHMRWIMGLFLGVFRVRDEGWINWLREIYSIVELGNYWFYSLSSVPLFPFPKSTVSGGPVLSDVTWLSFMTTSVIVKGCAWIISPEIRNFCK